MEIRADIPVGRIANESGAAVEATLAGCQLLRIDGELESGRQVLSARHEPVRSAL